MSEKPTVPDPDEFDPDEADIDPEIEKRWDVAHLLASSGFSDILVLDATDLASLSSDACEAFERLQRADLLESEVSDDVVSELVLRDIATVEHGILTLKHKHIASISS